MNKIANVKNLMAFSILAMPGLALAQATNAGGMADAIYEQFGSFSTLLIGAAFLLGLFLGVKAILGFKKNSEDGGREGIGKPVTYAVLAFVAVSFGTFLTVGNASIFGGDGTVGVSQIDGFN